MDSTDIRISLVTGDLRDELFLGRSVESIVLRARRDLALRYGKLARARKLADVANSL